MLILERKISSFEGVDVIEGRVEGAVEGEVLGLDFVVFSKIRKTKMEKVQ